MEWTIVIVDDDKQVIHGIESTISHINTPCKVVGTATNGETGAEMILAKQPDLVITDIYMPKMDGIEMIKVLRQHQFLNEIIILSGYSEFKHAQQALKLKIADYLSKPASRTTIISTIESVLHQLENNRKAQQNYQQYKTKVKQYDRYITEELIELAIKGQLNLTTLQMNQQKIINQWDSCLHLPIKMNFTFLNQNNGLAQHDQLMHFAIANIIKDTLYDFAFDYHYIEIDRINSILCLHTTSDQHIALSNQVQAILNKIEVNLHQLLPVKLDIVLADYVSTWTETLSEIHSLLMKAAQQQSFTKEITPLKKQLAQAIRSTDLQLIQKTLENFFGKISDQAFLPSIALHVGIELWTIFKYELQDNGIKIASQVDAPFNLYQQFVQFRSWQELDQFFKQLLERLSKEALFQNNIRHSKLIEEVLCYIENHLSDPITLSEIAENLYISRNYLGQLFKNKMKITFKAYLTQVRIEHARKLLLTGNYMIYEVAEAVGFDNPAYFTAVFKKEIGYSPSQLIQEDIK